MKRVLIIFLAVMLALSVPASILAGPSGPAGNSNIGHLYLYQKDTSDWSIVEGGAWGKLKYNQSCFTFDYVFNGHGLAKNTEYSLIYYADPWPGNNPGMLIASGESNPGGNINLVGSIDLGMDLPSEPDQNFPDGAKIWLVLSSDYDVATNQMTAWNPDSYLFEAALISYDWCGNNQEPPSTD